MDLSLFCQIYLQLQILDKIKIIIALYIYLVVNDKYTLIINSKYI